MRGLGSGMGLIAETYSTVGRSLTGPALREK